MFALYHEIFYQPLLNTLVFLYETIALYDFGLAIIIFTLVIRVLLFPLFQKSIRYQTTMQHLQPEMKRIEDETKKDKEREVKEKLALYKKHHVNPFYGFFFIVVQLIILIALFHILNSYKETIPKDLYPFIPSPPPLNETLFGLINLTKSNILLVSVAAIAQYFQGKLSLPKKQSGVKPSHAELVGRQMVYVGPVIMLVAFASLPAAIPLYFLVSTLFSIAQQLVINKELNNGTVGTIHKTTS